MRVLGKVMGILLLVLFGMPLLLAVSWATGMTQAVLSEGFFVDVSERFIQKTPALIETTFEAMKQPGAVHDAEDQRWVDAIVRTEPPLPRLLETTGLFQWMQGEVARTVAAVGEVLHGDRAPEDVVIDMRPLKQALLHPALLDYLQNVLAKLPPCDAAQAQRWRDEALSGRLDHDKDLPPCHPGLEVTDRVAALVALHTDKIPDDLHVFADPEEMPSFDTIRSVHSFVWLLFLVPLLFIALGAHLAGRDGKGFLRWSGAAVLLTGLFSLLVAGAASGWFLPYIPWQPGNDGALWTSAAGRVFAQEIHTLIGGFLDDLFASVRTVSIVVSGVGAALVVGSFFARRAQPERA